MHTLRDAHAGTTFAHFNVHNPAASKLAHCFLVQHYIRWLFSGLHFRFVANFGIP